MFEIEILKLLNEYKKTTDEYTLNKIKDSIYNLIIQNPEKLEKFLSTQQIDEDSKNFIIQCKKEAENKQKQATESEENQIFSQIKIYYQNWLESYKKNNNIPEEYCEKIVEEIITYCIEDKYIILEKILEIDDNEDYESFKNMLKNYIRKHLAQKILNYYNEEKFSNLSFFAKRKKRKQLVKILDEIGRYKFNFKKIYEAIEK